MELRPGDTPPAGGIESTCSDAGQSLQVQRKSKKTPTRASVVEGDTHKGKSFSLANELTIGRADNCSLILDDAYVSQMHAHLPAR